MSRKPEGVSPRHRRGCPNTGRMEWGCGCPETYQAQVFDRRTGQRPTRTFTAAKQSRPLQAAIAWRDDKRVSVRSHGPGVKAPTVRQAADELVEGMRAGVIVAKSRQPYKPSVIRDYSDRLEQHIVPSFGPYRLDELQSADIERVCFGWLAKGKAPSTVHGRLMPLRAIYRRALRLRQLSVNPMDAVELPAVQDLKERRFVDAKTVAALLASAPAEDRAIWATAFYTGPQGGRAPGPQGRACRP
jgi:hypothetical protein